MTASEISGDIRLSAADRLRYLWWNALRNLSSIGRGPRTRPFFPDLRRASQVMAGQSPSRLAMELFLEAELPRLSPPRQLDVIEIGCGSGSMAARIAGFGYGGTYLGIDIQDRFRRDQPLAFAFEAAFQQTDAHAFSPPQRYDLMLSSSALEHIPDDTVLIRRLPSFMKPGGLEVHVLPSGASLATYLWHGYRQYTPVMLAERFGDDIEIVRLGGLGSYLLHGLFITGPEMLLHRSLRKAMPRIYLALLRAALRIDRVIPVCPNAYAVIRRH
jgi:SAM-dependent methyltransferase